MEEKAPTDEGLAEEGLTEHGLTVEGLTEKRLTDEDAWAASSAGGAPRCVVVSVIAMETCADLLDDAEIADLLLFGAPIFVVRLAMDCSRVVARAEPPCDQRDVGGGNACLRGIGLDCTCGGTCFRNNR